MPGEIDQAQEAFQGLTRRLHALRGMECYGELLEAASHVQEQIAILGALVASSAQQQLALMQEKERLEAENVALLDWGRTAKNYALKDIGNSVFVQASKPDLQAGEAQHEPARPAHWACARCFEDRKISILQRDMQHKYVCPRCAYTIDGRLVKPPQP